MDAESRTPFLDAELAGHQDRTSIGNILAPARPLSPHCARPSPDALLWQRHTSEPTRRCFFSFPRAFQPHLVSRASLHLLFFLTSPLISAHARARSLSFSLALIASLCFFYGFVRVPVHADLGAQSLFAGSRAATGSSFCSLYHDGTVPQLPDFGRSRLCSPFELHCTCMMRNVI